MENCKTHYCKVCVTGGSGYIGSYLIKKLLDKGTYIVHATIRNFGDSVKVGLLKSLPGAEKRLKLFEADIYNPQQFEPAIKDCQYVFHVATPYQHDNNSNYKDTSEAAVAGVKSIAMSCIRSGTVKRLIYTASVVSASPIINDGDNYGYLDFMDENCWTPSILPLNFGQDFEKDYMVSKTKSEKEVLMIGDGEKLEVVTLACGLVGGDTLLSYTPASVACFTSLVSNKEHAVLTYQQLRFVEEMCGKIPVLHIDDACEAHIFCMEKETIKGRFLCASDYVSSAEIAEYYKRTYPEFHVKSEYSDVPKRTTRWGSTKLIDAGFEYKYSLKMILDDLLKCARRFDAI